MDLLHTPFESEGSPFVNGDLRFTDVGFRYVTSDTSVFENVDLSIKRNSFVVIKGSSGVGKTTLIDLICRLLAPTKGSITIGDMDIKNIDLAEYCRQLGYVGQDNALINDTVLNNLVLGAENISADQLQLIWAYLKDLQLDDVIRELPEGLETVVGKRRYFSGGQRQRLLILREVLKKPSLLILDEATSGLDTATHNQTINFIRKSARRSTIIYITHKEVDVEMYDAVYVFGRSGFSLLV